MTEDAAGVLAWAQRTGRTSEEAWEEMQALNEQVDWDVEQMLEAVDERHPEASK